MTATGALILSFFALLWWVVGLRAAGHGPGMVYAVPIAVTAVLGLVARHVARRRGDASDPNPAEEARRGRLVGWASAAEGIAIFVASNSLVNTGHADAIAPAIALIVGGHFVPLAWGLPAPAYYITAIILAALGLAGLAVTDLSSRLTLVCAGAAGVLWLTALVALTAGHLDHPLPKSTDDLEGQR